MGGDGEEEPTFQPPVLTSTQEMKSRKICVKMRKTRAHLNVEGRKEVTGKERLQIQERGSPNNRTGQD